MLGAIATMAMVEGGTLLNAPDVYMQKIAVGPGYDKGIVALDAPPADNIRRLAKAKRRAILADHCARHGLAAT
jgi:fructose-1,6-bisphosphatase II / sedoheptulose-1,7-bisphosphatase